MENTQQIITWQEYSNHITPQDCWVLIDGYVYNVSDYLVEHPGGDDILLK
jgi:cytochrome b involved in lipid metabolism